MMSQRMRDLFALIAASIELIVVCGALTSASDGIIAANARKVAPDFTLTDSTGATIRLSNYKGEVVLLDFWATWCTGCKVEIPWYMEFQKQYAKQGLRSIGVAMDEEGWRLVRPYLEAHPINYPIVLGNPALVKPYQITNMPVTLLIDRTGNVADTHVGIVDKDEWEQEIQQLLSHEGSLGIGEKLKSLIGLRQSSQQRTPRISISERADLG